MFKLANKDDCTKLIYTYQCRLVTLQKKRLELIEINDNSKKEPKIWKMRK